MEHNNDNNLNVLENSSCSVQALCDLLRLNEEYLLDRIVEYGKYCDYTKYTSTLREAWRISVVGLTDAIIKALAFSPKNIELNPEDNYTTDPIGAFGIIEARRHRNRGVTLGMFLGLMKYYRQGYLDLIEQADINSEQRKYYHLLIQRIFDRIEICFCVTWCQTEGEELVQELQSCNREMTNEKTKLLTIFESIPSAAILVGINNNVENINFAGRKLFYGNARPGEDVYIKDIIWKLPEWLLNIVEKFYAKDIVNFKEEYSLPCGSDSNFYEISLERMMDISGKFKGTVVIINDITQINLAKEKAEAANAAKSTFLSNMSHELRTPLNAILGYAQLMQRDLSLQAEQKQYLNIINRSGEHLLALINDVLEIAKIEAQRIKVNLISFDLHALFSDLEMMFRIRTDAKSLQFEIDIAPDVPRYVLADEHKLRQILINLLGNAVKFTKEGGISVRVSINAVTTGQLQLVVEVEDTGGGIAAEEMDKLFQYFEQTASGRLSGGGTGLGLVISQEYARMMGGDITVTSRVSKGSIFCLAISITTSQVSDIKETSNQYRVIGIAAGQNIPRILVADDTQENRDLLVKLLEMTGFEVRQATNGWEAVQIFEQWRPQFIWMDVRMPVMDGIEATRYIKATQIGKFTPVVALTASIFEEGYQSILAAGFDDLLRKPYREHDVFALLAKHLDLKYVYESQPIDEIPLKTETEMLPEQLAAILPNELRNELHTAVLRLDIAQTMAIIKRINAVDAAVGKVFTKLAENLDFNSIITLLENKGKEAGDTHE